MNSKQHGFTIVELLIVIVVIGVLAAIVIVSFNGVQNRANDTAIRSDLRNFGQIIEQHTIVQGAYPTSLTRSMGISFSRNAYAVNRNNLYYCVNTSTNQFALFAQGKSGNSFILTSDSGVGNSASLNAQQTCAAIGLVATNPHTTAYNFSDGTGWNAGWVNP